jgi:hypothetical protein
MRAPLINVDDISPDLPQKTLLVKRKEATGFGFRPADGLWNLVPISLRGAGYDDRNNNNDYREGGVPDCEAAGHGMELI